MERIQEWEWKHTTRTQRIQRAPCNPNDTVLSYSLWQGSGWEVLPSSPFLQAQDSGLELSQLLHTSLTSFASFSLFSLIFQFFYTKLKLMHCLISHLILVTEV